MKIKRARFNNRKKVFVAECARGAFELPYAKVEPMPEKGNLVSDLFIDDELGRDGFVYTLRSGETGTVLLDQFFDYNREPEYMRDLLLHKLTVAVVQRLEKSSISKRELARRLGTSATQLYRLLDTANYSKSVSQMLTVLHILDCEVSVVIKDRKNTQIVECAAW